MPYLERLFASLKKAKLVKAERGASGGYELSRKPADITSYEIIKALEGGFEPFHCLVGGDKKTCAGPCHCEAESGLSKIEAEIARAMKGISLRELAK